MSANVQGEPDPTDDVVSDALDDNDEEEFEDEQDSSPACPICRCVVSEDVCEHIVSLIGSDQIDLQVCAVDHETPLRNVISQFAGSFAEAFTEAQLQMIVKLLELPADAFRLAKVGLECEGPFEGIENYFQDVVARVPGYAGSEDCSGDGGGTSSDWSTAWAKDAKKAGLWLDREIPRDIKRLEREFGAVIKAGKSGGKGRRKK